MGIRECVALLKKIRDPSTAARRDEWVLFKPDPRTLPVLLMAADHQSHKIRWAAAKALSEIGGEKALKMLIGLLKDKDQGVCQYAAEALGRLGDRKATMPLAEALKGSEHYLVRLKAVRALGQFKDKRSVEALAGAVRRDENYDVRAQAAHVLGEIGDKRAVDALAVGMNGKYSDRKACIRALGKIGCPSAVKALINQFAEIDTWITKRGTLHYTSRDGKGGGVAGPYIQIDNTALNIAEVLEKTMPKSFPYFTRAAGKKKKPVNRLYDSMEGFGTAESRAKRRKEKTKVMLAWLEEHKDRLVWDPKTRHFNLKPEEEK
jgi:HEAT repeat protein